MHEIQRLLYDKTAYLPLFEPARAPYLLTDRVVMGIRDLVLVGAAVFAGASRMPWRSFLLWNAPDCLRKSATTVGDA